MVTDYPHSFLVHVAAAPGTYSPEKTNSDKGPQYSLTGKGAPEKLNDNPGECHDLGLYFQSAFLLFFRHAINAQRKNNKVIDNVDF